MSSSDANGDVSPDAGSASATRDFRRELESKQGIGEPANTRLTDLVRLSEAPIGNRWENHKSSYQARSTS